MTKFHVRQHSADGDPIVEVWDGDQFIAGVYPDKMRRGVKIISKFAMAITLEDEPKPAAVIVEIGTVAIE